ncbi:MAG: MBL fold metallo-hydrolase [Actinomycetia bacterium]|nr:MBL fold metallo-hydrolase [Actinomycetes bacterium]
MTGADEITWVGHATVLFDIGGYRVITDPALTRRVAHLRRRCPVPDRAVADVDLVLLSHTHMDHLHLPSLHRVRPTAHIITPDGSAPLLRAAGLSDITEVEVGDRIHRGPLTIEVVPAAHSPERGPHSRINAQPVGYVVDTGTRRLYFAGDTDLFPAMEDLAAIDVALLPIWGWGSTIGNGHLDPGRATEASRLIRPQLVVPMHWGTYAPEDGRRRRPPWFDDPIESFQSEFGAAGELERLRIVEPGGVLLLGPPPDDEPLERL